MGSGSPDATRNCHSTRSCPVIASVTGCSTCSRVFISMNQMRSARQPRRAVGDELDRARADIIDRLSPPSPPPRRSPRAWRRPCRARAPPRSPSGDGAGASSRARTGGRPAPCVSPNTCTSIWRGREDVFLDQHLRSSPNEAAASRRQLASISAKSVCRVDPPHPLAAAARDRLDEHRIADRIRFGLEAFGRLVLAEIAGRHRHARRRSSAALAASFSPIARMLAGGAPTQTSPAAITASANSAFSDRKP